MEREVLITGIGGQGVQLAATVIAHAAMAEGREVQVFGSYGGMMRGGNTDSALVIADRPIVAPPTVDQAWSAVLMHPAHADGPLRALRADGFCMVNSTVFGDGWQRPDHPSIDVPATAVAHDLGNAVVASMVMVGAYAAVTGLVALPSLTRAVGDALPSYRRSLADLNTRALHAGFEAVPGVLRPAWDETADVAP
ncbi:MAG TPA: 2-oxoacid:acceptor oxidoreductase family protein [Acidimicrobiales bacterium]|nr:2-oxoacid:acceptor oxidoreductase family protein [Acidimicrobiales bacterium]